MTWTLLDSDTAAFADGGSGHVLTYPGGAPNQGDLLLLAVNSNTTVSTPSGWTLINSDVQNQGAYLFGKRAGASEASSVTVTTTGNHNTTAAYLRYSGAKGSTLADALDVTVKATVINTAGTVTPAVDTGALAETGELVVACAQLHEFPGSAPTGPSWSTGYTNRASATQGSGASACAVFAADTRNAGTPAEAPQASWTNSAANRTILVATFKAAAGAVQTTARLAVGAAGAGAGVKQAPSTAGVRAGLAGRGATVNGIAPPGLLANNEMVTVTWLRTAYTGWDAMVATTLPRNNATWAEFGFVQVRGAVGGSSTPYVPLKQPVMQIDCWAVNPESGRPPWGRANQLAEAIRAACFDESRMQRELTLPGDFPPARVLSAYLLSEPRRIWSDDASYARYTFQLAVHWVELPR